MVSTTIKPSLDDRTPLGRSPKNHEVGSFSWVRFTFFASIHAVALLAPWHFSWSALGITIFLHWLTGSLGICLGFHRLLTHRSFRVPKPLEYCFAICGCLALEGGPIFWVAGHRQHHLHTEHREKDPYSAKRGLLWSHMQWILYRRPEFFDYEAYSTFAPDLAKDPVYRWLDKYFLLLQLPMMIALYAMGGWDFVIYGMGVRLVLLWHSTWFINSVCHLWGNRTYDCDDDSRNLWWAAILAYGEGWHNNHHAHPNVAPAGRTWWQIDMTWWVINGLKQVGLATHVVMPPQHP
ncbi:MAG: fatty acid desaturase [Cyanobacteria bacterium P01_E01_bin.6]